MTELIENPYLVGNEYVIPAWWMKREKDGRFPLCNVKVLSVFRHEDKVWPSDSFNSMMVQPLEGNPHQRSVHLNKDGTVQDA